MEMFIYCCPLVFKISNQRSYNYGRKYSWYYAYTITKNNMKYNNMFRGWFQTATSHMCLSCVITISYLATGYRNNNTAQLSSLIYKISPLDPQYQIKAQLD